MGPFSNEIMQVYGMEVARVQEAQENALTQNVADLEVEILTLVRKFERKTGRRVDHIGLDTRSNPLEGYQPDAEYYSKYTSRIVVNIVSVETDAEFRRMAKERQQAREAERKAEAERKVAAAAEQGLADLNTQELRGENYTIVAVGNVEVTEAKEEKADE